LLTAESPSANGAKIKAPRRDAHMAKRSSGASAEKRWTEDEARAVLAAWAESGQSGAEFARARGLVAQRLFWWRRRFARSALSAAAFVPMVANPLAALGSVALVVTTASGARIEVFEVDASTAAWVAAVIGGGPER
jgi:transposase-like protein